MTPALARGAETAFQCGIYTRVSTRDAGQDTENQRRQLIEFCEKQGWCVVSEYGDHDSGAKRDRAALNRMNDAAQRRFGVLVFWSLDRLTREGALATLEYLTG